MTQTPLNVVVLVSGNGSNLQAIIDNLAEKAELASVVAVISNESDAYGLKRAESANIEAVCLEHRKFDSRESYDEALLKTIMS